MNTKPRRDTEKKENVICGKDSSAIFAALGKIETAINEKNLPLAFACTIELLCKLSTIHIGSTVISTVSLSKTARAAIGYIESNFCDALTFEKISKQTGCSPSYLSRCFKREIGAGVHEYLTDYRICKAAAMLREHSVTEVCYMCGFSDSSHFISLFKKRFGVTPKQYKKSET